jgi:predicted GNAT family acetyltransferase
MSAMSHPLDRAVWTALATRQSAFALGDDRARRLRPDIGLFAAAADSSPESLAALGDLIRATGPAGLFEADPPSRLPGLTVTPGDPISQMVAERTARAPPPSEPDFTVVQLGEADAADMLALATLTQPGPFFAQTRRLGDFIGVRVDGRLAAMAGERLRLPGFTEVSAVCTHPDFRGRGYAAGLMGMVTRAIHDRGEIAFLHVYDRNQGAVRLYESLGWRRRRSVVVSFVTPEPP